MGISRPKDEYEEKMKKERKKKRVAKEVEKKPEVKRAIVRVANTNLDGEKALVNALREIKGIGYAMSKAICTVANLDPRRKLGSLSESELENLEQIINNPIKFGVPAFLVNRRKDLKTGEDLHLIGAELDIAKKFDIQRYIELRTYRGWRHMLGQPVRGQRTKSHFRKGRAVGVIKKAVRLQMSKKKE